jgi:hypothetical protein
MGKLIEKLMLKKYALTDVELVNLSGQSEMTSSCESSNVFLVP